VRSPWETSLPLHLMEETSVPSGIISGVKRLAATMKNTMTITVKVFDSNLSFIRFSASFYLVLKNLAL
jgi:hypothetical protein